MNPSFAERMLLLRKKKNLSQKQAAESLGVSQALLSHYEKGIRECSLGFLVKAAAFYDVSSDYLLGLSDSEKAIRENFDNEDDSLDAEFRTSTLFRAASMLRDDFEKNGAEKGDYVKQYFALTVYQLTVLAARAGYVPKSWIGLGPDSAAGQSKAMLEQLSRNLIRDTQEKTVKNIRQPLCLKTIISTAERLIVRNARQIGNTNLD